MPSCRSPARPVRVAGRGRPKRHRDDLRFVLRGDLLVGLGVVATLATDVLAIAQHPRGLADDGAAALVLVGGLVALAIGTAVTLALLALAWRRLDRTLPRAAGAIDLPPTDAGRRRP